MDGWNKLSAGIASLNIGSSAEKISKTFTSSYQATRYFNLTASPRPWIHLALNLKQFIENDLDRFLLRILLSCPKVRTRRGGRLPPCNLSRLRRVQGPRDESRCALSNALESPQVCVCSLMVALHAHTIARITRVYESETYDYPVQV
jgi:hypothetical protein